MLTLHRLIHHLRHPAPPCQNLVYNETFLVVLANPQTEVNTNFGAAEAHALRVLARQLSCSGTRNALDPVSGMAYLLASLIDEASRRETVEVAAVRDSTARQSSRQRNN